jgi:hypothetical protein
MVMEKINVAELLKGCPSGMELDCYLFNGLEFDHIDTDNENYPIVCRAKTLTGEYNMHSFTKYGWFTASFDYAKCVIFPKGKTTWEGFQRPFKDGDVIFTHANCLKVGLGNTWISIYQENRNGGVATYVDYAEDGSDYYSDIDGDKAFLCMENDILRQRLATEEEKAKLFKAIKDNGYKWNSETKTLEKLIPNKFDINNLVPFESKVLVRSDKSSYWKPAIFGCYIENMRIPYYALDGTCWHQCIPYECNEHLLGTTDDCDEYFKTWE